MCSCELVSLQALLCMRLLYFYFCLIYSNIVVTFFLVTPQCSDINNRWLKEAVCGAAKTVGGYLSIQWFCISIIGKWYINKVC